MNTPDVQSPTAGQHFVDPTQSAISQGCECEEGNPNCPCPDEGSSDNPQGRQTDWNSHLWGFLVASWVTVGVSIIIWAFQELSRSGRRGGRGGGATGSGGSGNASTQKPSEAGPPAASARLLTEMARANTEMHRAGFQFFVPADERAAPSFVYPEEAVFTGGARMFEIARPAAAFAGR